MRERERGGEEEGEEANFADNENRARRWEAVMNCGREGLSTFITP